MPDAQKFARAEEIDFRSLLLQGIGANSRPQYSWAQTSKGPALGSADLKEEPPAIQQPHVEDAHTSSLSTSLQGSLARTEQLGSCLKPESVFILASVPASAAAFTDAESAQIQLRILSDTVCPLAFPLRSFLCWIFKLVINVVLAPLKKIQYHLHLYSKTTLPHSV